MDAMENAVNGGIGFELPGSQDLRRPPKPPLSTGGLTESVLDLARQIG